MAQLQQIQKQHANQHQFNPQSRIGDRKPGVGGSIVPPPMSLPLPLPLPSSAVGGGFGDRPTPTKAQLTMPPRLNHKAPGQHSRLDLPPEESTDLEELEQFAKMFKQKRIKLGKYLYRCIDMHEMWPVSTLFLYFSIWN